MKVKTFFSILSMFLLVNATPAFVLQAAAVQCGEVTLDCQDCNIDFLQIFHLCQCDTGCSCGSNHNGNCVSPATCTCVCSGGTIKVETNNCSALAGYIPVSACT